MGKQSVALVLGVVTKAKHLFITFIGITLLAFIMVRLVPGDPILLLLGERGGSPEVYQAMQVNMGLDKPLFVQYFIYIKNILFHGDLGNSIVSRVSVWDEFTARFPATLELASFAMIFAILVGIPVGIIAAVKRNSTIDVSAMGLVLTGYSMPIFWWGLILILFFSVHLGWTPVSGRIDPMLEIPKWSGFYLIDSWLSEDGVESFLSALRYLVLPGIAMGTIPLAVVARMTRSSLIEVLGEDYIRTAWAKGATSWVVTVKHGLRNALLPIVTVVGLMVGTLLTGAILTETIFSWPGIGKWILSSVQARDYPVIQGGVLILASLIALVNIGMDFLYVIINPRLRSGGSL